MPRTAPVADATHALPKSGVQPVNKIVAMLVPIEQKLCSRETCLTNLTVTDKRSTFVVPYLHSFWRASPIGSEFHSKGQIPCHTVSRAATSFATQQQLLVHSGLHRS